MELFGGEGTEHGAMAPFAFCGSTLGSRPGAARAAAGFYSHVLCAHELNNLERQLRPTSLPNTVAGAILGPGFAFNSFSAGLSGATRLSAANKRAFSAKQVALSLAG